MRILQAFELIVTCISLLTWLFSFSSEVGGNSRPSTPTQGKSTLVTSVSQPEKEQMAMQWLKATFEPLVGAPSIEQNVLYKQYTAGCSKNGPKYLLATMQFYSCVRYYYFHSKYSSIACKNPNTVIISPLQYVYAYVQLYIYINWFICIIWFE